MKIPSPALFVLGGFVKKGPESESIRNLLVALEKTSKKSESSFWRNVSSILRKPRRRAVAVNVSKIAKNSKEGAAVVVPGKVLGGGSITHKVTVGALNFSCSAKEKIESTGGKAVDLEDFSRKHPKGTGLVLLR